MESLKFYFNHFKGNMIISGQAFVLCIFHFAHAIVPVKYTSHEYWGFKLTKQDKGLVEENKEENTNI